MAAATQVMFVMFRNPAGRETQTDAGKKPVLVSNPASKAFKKTLLKPQMALTDLMGFPMNWSVVRTKIFRVG